MAKTASMKKPNLSAVTAFAERKQHKAATTNDNSRFPPPGSVRLTVNLREDLHLKLKIKAAHDRRPIGKLVEEWVESM